MAAPFNADEVFQMAEQIEREEARFFRFWAERVRRPHLADMLLDLAAVEDEHERIFTAMRQDLKTDPAAGDYDPEGDQARYLRAFADGRIGEMRPDPEREFTGEQDLADVLRMAIRHENDSIAFFTGMKELVARKLGRERLDAIIREEMRHVTQMADALAELETPA